MIMRRNIMGGKSLPYDCLVDWIGRPLSGTSLSCILPFKPESNDVVEWSGCVLSGERERASLGWSAYLNEQTETTRVIINKNIASTVLCYFRSRANGGSMEVGLNATKFHSFILSEGKISIDGIYYSIASPNALSESRNPYNLIHSPNSRLARFKLTRGGEVIFDGVACRFTNANGEHEGGIYDKVSKTIYKGAGTGKYDIGPDKT